jgi:hypothetical protein
LSKQLKSLTTFPESHGLSPENDDFPYEIRDKVVGLGSWGRGLQTSILFNGLSPFKSGQLTITSTHGNGVPAPRWYVLSISSFNAAGIGTRGTLAMALPLTMN